MILKKIKAILLCFSMVVLSSCSVDDGKDGLNGVGFDELTKFGSVKMTFSGTRPDDVIFTNTSDFKFTSVEGSDYNNSNSVQSNGDDLAFTVLRFLSSPDDVYQESTVSFRLNVTDAGLETQSLALNSFRIENFAVIGDDLKYFVLSDSYNTTSTSANFQILNYSFNDETNKLEFTFSFDVPASDNDSGNDMTVKGEVSVVVLEEI
ncbi:hypothetical protein FIA58_003220 [Flavobacterium jejuense]|uniref:DUF5017 domain-containing protein n=1 Tax=Flavobacterium jejuense TaxID=1544455 RepID=A0ABX0IN78_9FLAO|nr:hypothetical protein [Flavobacterium jejuense]NHN24676.1 hypothetical protein [Flavobacterium jejuense]